MKYIVLILFTVFFVDPSIAQHNSSGRIEYCFNRIIKKQLYKAMKDKRMKLLTESDSIDYHITLRETDSTYVFWLTTYCSKCLDFSSIETRENWDTYIIHNSNRFVKISGVQIPIIPTLDFGFATPKVSMDEKSCIGFIRSHSNKPIAYMIEFNKYNHEISKSGFF